MSNPAAVYVLGRRQTAQLKSRLAKSEQDRQKAVDDYLDLEQMHSIDRVISRRSPQPGKKPRPSHRTAPKSLSTLVTPGILSGAMILICQQGQALGLIDPALAVPGIAISLIVLSFTAGKAAERMK